MSTPTSDPRQESLLEQSARRKTFPFTVALIVAIHVVGACGLLFLGCGPDQTASNARPPGSEPVVPASPVVEPVRPPAVPPVDTPRTEAVRSEPQAPAVPPVTTSGASVVTGSSGGGGLNLPPAVPAAQETVPAPVPEAASEYKIQAGDNAWKIAKAKSVSVDSLLKANPTVEWRKLKLGQPIQVPPPGTGMASADGSATGGSSRTGGGLAAAGSAGGVAAGAGAGAGGGRGVHEVKAGENLSKIARQYGVTVKEIRAANRLSTDAIRVKQKLVIPVKKMARATTEAGGGAAGDSAPAPVEPRAIPAVPGGQPR